MADSTIIWVLLTALFAGCITSIQSTEAVVDHEQSGSSSAELIGNVPRQPESSPMELVGNVPPQTEPTRQQRRVLSTALPIDIIRDVLKLPELPIEVLREVFSHLSIEDLIAARMSCRTFNSVISEDPFHLDLCTLRCDRLSVISQIPDAMSRMAAHYERSGTVTAVDLRKEHTYRAITHLCTEDVIVGDAVQALPDVKFTKLMNMSNFITAFVPDHGQVVVGELVLRQMLREILLSDGTVGPTADTFAHLPRSIKVAVINAVDQSLTRFAESITDDDDGIPLDNFPFDLVMFLNSYVDGPPIPAPDQMHFDIKGMMCLALHPDRPQPQLVRLVAQLGGSCLGTHLWSFLLFACETGRPDVVQALLETSEAPQQLIWHPSVFGSSILYDLGSQDTSEDSKVAIAAIILTFCKNPRDLILTTTIGFIKADHDSTNPADHDCNDPDYCTYQTWPSEGNSPLHDAISGGRTRLLEFYLTKLHQLDPDIFIRGGLFDNLFEFATYIERERRSGAIGVLQKFDQILLRTRPVAST